ncbi:glycosyltransferase family 2 protein [Mastigocladopsis repens]|uniref:glycosyltransferase family 2 protein n=1 Tax=Mastigocladopsis repens TaxID=221287 RepID=UPI0002DBA6CB|nr:glycosyltransferase [Mastigocladopsis repens]
MRVSACITTRNRTKNLDECLEALWNSNIKPHRVVVSDDSPTLEVQQQNSQIVEKYPGTTYIIGPRRGVCANRNNAVNAIPASETDFVAFIDDDICVKPDFIAGAVDRYTQMSPEQRNYTILSGVSQNPNGTYEMVSGKLSFRGYFCHSDAPESVAIHAALFPRSLFEQEQWDENIFFGYEDAELCLRALKRGCRIIHCPELRVIHAGGVAFKSTLHEPGIGCLTKYEISIEAARLYVGIKRYKNLYPNPVKLVAFLILYFVHMTAYLLKKGAIQAWPEIVRLSQIQRLWQPSVV